MNAAFELRPENLNQSAAVERKLSSANLDTFRACHSSRKLGLGARGRTVRECTPRHQTLRARKQRSKTRLPFRTLVIQAYK